jgi:hypothetical protein
VVGSWFSLITPIGSNLTFQTAVTFTANGQFTWDETKPAHGEVTKVQATYAVGPIPKNSLTFLTMVSQAEFVFQGLYARPGPGEFIIETFADWSLVGGPDFFLFNRQKRW